jgi:glucosamine--fructose-6-phosphate aminotransferase (isomerizing)
MACMHTFRRVVQKTTRVIHAHLRACLPGGICFGRCPASTPQRTLIVFPCTPCTLTCGLAGMVAFGTRATPAGKMDIASLLDRYEHIETAGIEACRKKGRPLIEHYLNGDAPLNALLDAVQQLKKGTVFVDIFRSPQQQQELRQMADRLHHMIATEQEALRQHMGRLTPRESDVLAQRLETLLDIRWCLEMELMANLGKIQQLINRYDETLSPLTIDTFKQINAVLNSIDRLEVRGRDSAGISLMFVFGKTDFEKFRETLYHAALLNQLKDRTQRSLLLNNSIAIHDTVKSNDEHNVTMTLTYKVAAEIGSLGDNVRFLRNQIKNDQLLQILATFPYRRYTVTSHTRWASVGAISEANCHPVDNDTKAPRTNTSGLIHVCLNGDIDNYLELRQDYENRWTEIPEEISTDTKIIPLQIESYLKNGHDIKEAFLMAVNDFEGSHAISMHTNLAPGKIFLAQRGSGQSIYIGMAEDHYMPVSEVYGFVEETQRYVKMDGETVTENHNGRTQGQIFILNQDSTGELDGLEAMHYDGSPLPLNESDIKTTEITSRDIDRQGFPHYFLKEISEAPESIVKTLQNRWIIAATDQDEQLTTQLDATMIPPELEKAFNDNTIRRIFFIGQGTAGIAAQACANILNHYMNTPLIQISALIASELSGFRIGQDDDADSMRDALVIAISQSGTTTDTNRSVDMVRACGARTLAIVNRRDSDLTFRTDGVIYTSSGRDIEMSVASTKAFYSQIVAGAILGLHLARITGRRNPDFVSREIRQLLDLPAKMQTVLSSQTLIEASARRLAPRKIYWATVGSGPNKASADEIRIKLSELCYKTISTDFVEDKKHIDLSSEPLIIVCAAGMRPNVIGDIAKDTAIFKAHKAATVVIADENDHRFDTYADDVFRVPAISEHLAPILNTLVGHLWGYYAALSINEGSHFLFRHREEIQRIVDDHTCKGLDVFEVILDKNFREKTFAFYNELIGRKKTGQLPVSMGFNTTADLLLLLKYLAGRLPVADFELDFGMKGTPLNMLNTLFECLAQAINTMARPIDAIKHQAKTVTVGTSRLSEKVEGLLFEVLADNDISAAQISNKNVIVLKNLQGIVAGIKGYILYRIGNLNLLGEPTDDTTIEIVRKEGRLKSIPSRVETDPILKGTKKIIVREGNVYIGKGLKDGRSILVIPVISASESSPNMIEYLLSLNVSFRENVPLFIKIKALGGKFERIRNLMQEKSIPWQDDYLERVEIHNLFGDSAEKICDFIAAQLPSPSC